MKKIPLYLFLFITVLIMASCGSSATDNHKAAGEAKDILDSNVSDDDRELIAEIPGSWTSTETVRGETIVFNKDGKYSGYDGREEYKGTWKISDHKINLSTGGIFWLNIKSDTMMLDSIKYIKDHPETSMK
jgi:heat shock protein HslJ